MPLSLGLLLSLEFGVCLRFAGPRQGPSCWWAPAAWSPASTTAPVPVVLGEAGVRVVCPGWGALGSGLCVLGEARVRVVRPVALFLERVLLSIPGASVITGGSRPLWLWGEDMRKGGLAGSPGCWVILRLSPAAMVFLRGREGKTGSKIRSCGVQSRRWLTPSSHLG